MGAYLDHRCALGMILGTGSNGAYIEKVERIEKWHGIHTEKEVQGSIPLYVEFDSVKWVSVVYIKRRYRGLNRL